MLPSNAAFRLPAVWGPLATFQLNVASRWLERGRLSQDMYAQFFFYFAGFNALYFLWGKVDDVRNQRGEPAGEEKQIHHLLGKLGHSAAEEMLKHLDGTVRFYQERRPIQRMDRRGATNPVDGEIEEGRKWRDRLSKGEPADRLLALGSLLYLVRSNLVHGSKMEAGDDAAVVQHAVPAVRVLLERSLAATKSALAGGDP